ncbi:MAG TPA: DUF1911 domain-containing protein [Bacteroidia bacterium]|nr:DUF1911 domain-containing protein [Bacteroidia bacterium]
MRDSNKDKIYFDNIINVKYKGIEKRLEKFFNHQIKSDRIKIVKRQMSGTFFDIINAKYSRGDYMYDNNVLSDYKKGIDLMYENWEKYKNNYKYSKYRKIKYLNQYTFSGYMQMAQILSLGILLNVPKEYIEKFAEIIDKDNVKDFLFEFLLNYKLNNRKFIKEESYSHVFHINERLGLLKEIIKKTEKTKAEKELKFFLEKKWYQSFKGTPLYNSHKNNHNTYIGYWCYIVAAIVKIKKLDDCSFKMNQYYPKDLLTN